MPKPRKNSPLPVLDIDQQKVWDLIRGRDKENPILTGEICAETGFNERRVRLIVRELIIDHNLPVGSVSAGRAGYFRMVSLSEIDHAEKRLMHRGIEILRRARALRRMKSKYGEQVKMVFDHEP